MGTAPIRPEKGLEAYDVDVKATAIVNGEMVEGCASLGGSYFQADEPIGDVHGYLPQMLKEAAEELVKLTQASGIESDNHPAKLPVWIEAHRAAGYMAAVLKSRYEEQQQERTA